MDLNLVAFSGRLGQDPKMRYTSEGTAVANFSLAVQLAPQKTMWLDVTVWGKQAENVNQYLGKGSQVNISGRMDLDEWETDDGQKRKKLRVVANRVQFLGSPRDKQDGGSGSSQVGPLPEETQTTIDSDAFPL